MPQSAFVKENIVQLYVLSFLCAHETLRKHGRLVDTGVEQWIRETKNTTLFTVADIPTLSLSFIDFTYRF